MPSPSRPLISVSTLHAQRDAWQVVEVGIGKDPQAAAEAFVRPGHVPGACLADLASDFSAPEPAYPFQSPSAEQFAASARRLGLLQGKGIVVYDRGNGIWAARLWWLLRAFGQRHVRVLDGGLGAWQAAGLGLEQGPSSRVPGHWQATALQARYFAGLDQVQATSRGQCPGQLLNVLRRPVFTGAERRYARAGHIPGSLHIPYAEVLDADSGRWLARPALRQRFNCLDADQPIITYCGSGITAAGMALALLLSGREDVAIYEGSMTQWSADPALPLSTLSA